MKFSVFFLAILLFASCATSRYSEAEIERFKNIENPLERWKAHNIHNYNYDIKYVCYCPLGGKFKLKIRNDKVYEIIRETTGEKVTSTFQKYYHNFDELLNTLLKDGKFELATFDSVYGYPIHYYDEGDTDTMDDEFGYTISNVEFLD